MAQGAGPFRGQTLGRLRPTTVLTGRWVEVTDAGLAANQFWRQSPPLPDDRTPPNEGYTKKSGLWPKAFLQLFHRFCKPTILSFAAFLLIGPLMIFMLHFVD
jgi:heme A synthase